MSQAQKLEMEDKVKMEVDFATNSQTSSFAAGNGSQLQQKEIKFEQRQQSPTNPSVKSENQVKLSQTSCRMDPKNEDSPMEEVVQTKVPVLEHKVKQLKFSSVNFKSFDLIGEGTYGKVFKCLLDPKLVQSGQDWTRRYRALKYIKFESDKDGFPITALREIQILSQLQHANIVRLEEVHSNETKNENSLQSLISNPNDTKFSLQKQTVSLVFEYVPYDLFGIINLKPKYTAQQIGCLIKQVLEGLAHLEEKRVLHRDIKSANILITPSGVVKLCDFGLARIISTNRQNQTLTPKVVTRWYRAPEILLEDAAYSFGADIWAVGCVLAEILTQGKSMFQGKSDVETLSLICQMHQTQNLNSEDLSQLQTMFQKQPNLSMVTNGGLVQGQQAYWQKGVKLWLQQYSYLAGEPESETLFELCDQMLTFVKWKRPSATQLLNSSSFLANLNTYQIAPSLVPQQLRENESLTANEFTSRKRLA